MALNLKIRQGSWMEGGWVERVEQQKGVIELLLAEIDAEG